jgi:DNA-binding PadR family transcriptional regulator
MNPTRLFVLGALARHGPMYGHQIRRDARIDRTELWSEVKPGSLYAALHRLQAEGLIEPVRTEQQGNLPARTVYAITGEGRRELKVLRAEALREVALRPDPVDLALTVCADLDEDALRGFFASRREALAGRAAFFAREREQAWPDQTPADDLIMEHVTARIETELRWHDAVIERVGKLAASAAVASAAADARAAAASVPAASAAADADVEGGADGGGR